MLAILKHLCILVCLMNNTNPSKWVVTTIHIVPKQSAIVMFDSEAKARGYIEQLPPPVKSYTGNTTYFACLMEVRNDFAVGHTFHDWIPLN